MGKPIVKMLNLVRIFYEGEDSKKDLTVENPYYTIELND